jgi:hypothetical protein
MPSTKSSMTWPTINQRVLLALAAAIFLLTSAAARVQSTIDGRILELDTENQSFSLALTGSGLVIRVQASRNSTLLPPCLASGQRVTAEGQYSQDDPRLFMAHQVQRTQLDPTGTRERLAGCRHLPMQASPPLTDDPQ